MGDLATITSWKEFRDEKSCNPMAYCGKRDSERGEFRDSRDSLDQGNSIEEDNRTSITGDIVVKVSAHLLLEKREMKRSQNE